MLLTLLKYFNFQALDQPNLLKDNGIEIVKDLSGVGKNLRDHYNIRLQEE